PRTAANCRGIELDVFFPIGQGKMTGWDESRAKSVCQACTVLDACRRWALEPRPEFGIFGGLTADERRAALTAPRRRRMTHGR
ncbi:MAG: WhiB family transcriptional regulator, partial [Proteobacteria bacterium]